MSEKQKRSVNASTIKEKAKNASMKILRIFKRTPKEEREEQDEIDQKPRKWVQIRLFPIWLRVILVLLLLIVAALLGAYIGYSLLGDESPSGLFKKETWMHITDIIQGVE